MHLLLPLLIVLGIGVNSRLAILLAPLAILPDFDALTGWHRAVGHSFIPMIVMPVAILVYAKLKRPEWLTAALLVQFYLLSHLVLDISGVAFLWPFTTDMYYISATLHFSAVDGYEFDFNFDYGSRPYQSMGETDFISTATFGVLALVLLTAVVYRKEALGAARRVIGLIKDLFGRV
jgi:membrane-bound metal-dependent hydrolase YbcI (DUF457 family)